VSRGGVERAKRTKTKARGAEGEVRADRRGMGRSPWDPSIGPNHSPEAPYRGGSQPAVVAAEPQAQPQQPQARPRVQGRFVKRSDPLDRFWKVVDVGCPSDCWLWRGPLDRDGYAIFKAMRPDGTWASVRAHRWLYEQVHGPLPKGLQLDHVCHSRSAGCRGGACHHRRCVRPSHLEPVTRAEHNRRTHSRTTLAEAR